MLIFVLFTDLTKKMFPTNQYFLHDLPLFLRKKFSEQFLASFCDSQFLDPKGKFTVIFHENTSKHFKLTKIFFSIQQNFPQDLPLFQPVEKK